ncbi:MAG TPA: hypothetical protein VEP90_10865 [Methylomirabilota bacterium]|nr:hypothetical protein [Methylomirabilota bacterium]
MENTSSSSSRKDTLVAFRVAAEDVEYFKQSAEHYYKDGDIKRPNLGALAKHLLYRDLNILKGIDKARLWRAQQPRNLHNSTQEVEVPNLETTNVNNYLKDDYYDEGSVLKRPFFYELPMWKDRISRLRSQQ